VSRLVAVAPRATSPKSRPPSITTTRGEPLVSVAERLASEALQLLTSARCVYS
jgi:hypothetical protein